MANEYASIPEPQADLHSLYEVSSALKQTVEVLVGRRGSGGYAAVTAAYLASIANLAGSDYALVRRNLGIREVLNANRNYYAASTGSEANDGRSAITPVLTIQKMIDLAAATDLNGYQPIFNVAAGTYTGQVSVTKPWVGLDDNNPPTILGDTTTPANILINTAGTAITVRGTGTYLAIKGVKVQTSAGQGIAVLQGGRAIVNGNVTMGACAANKFQIAQFGWLNIAASYTDIGNAQVHFSLANNGVLIITPGFTTTLSGTPAYSTAFIQAVKAATTNAAGTTYSGTATGKRYNANTFSVIDSGGGGPLYFPGNVAGTSDGPGNYL